VGADFVLHPLIHTSGLSDSSTKCGRCMGMMQSLVCNVH